MSKKVHHVWIFSLGDVVDSGTRNWLVEWRRDMTLATSEPHESRMKFPARIRSALLPMPMPMPMPILNTSRFKFIVFFFFLNN